MPEIPKYLLEQFTALLIKEIERNPPTSCGGCGAPINEGRKCKYCGSLYRTPSEPEVEEDIGYPGITGYTGFTGYAGPTGYTGYTGFSGSVDVGEQEDYKKFWKNAYKERLGPRPPR
jgi:hypothetical protein